LRLEVLRDGKVLSLKMKLQPQARGN
jgi:hypothetical protein